LQAAGFEAQLVVVDSGADAADATPSLDQFNHMIVCLHEKDGDRFIDATDKESDPSLPVPFGLAGRKALLLDWKNPRLVQIPDYPAGSNTMDIQRTVRIDDDGAVQADDRISYNGYYASTMRSYLKPIEPTRRKTVWQSHFGGEYDIQIEEMSVDGLDDHRRPVVVSLKYKAPRALHMVDRQCVGRLPAPWEAAVLSADRMDHRVGPVWLQMPLAVRATIDIKPAADLSLPSPASFAEVSKTGIFQYGRTAAAAPEGLRLKCEAYRPAGHFPASFYASFVDQVEQTRSIFTPSLVLNRRDK
ncbi:MAG TPA: hypothetical protein VKB78_03185, partial [Pirellulales bacterium]|nr:hypothetical protein [Pirellulales bacterium]